MEDSVGKNTRNTLYIFIDESGDFNFSPAGSTYYILTAISTLDPLSSREQMVDLKYKLLGQGIDRDCFHATEDEQVVRNEVFARVKLLNDFEIHSVIAEKRKANLSLYERYSPDGSSKQLKKEQVEERFYKQICETLIQYLIRGYLEFKPSLGINKIVVVQDQVMTKRKREFVTKSVKTYVKDRFNLVPYMYFHQSKSDINCQIADYCCWAMKKKWKDNELRPYEEIKDKVESEFNIFSRGQTTYY
ncbi:MAG: hypothetical protein COV31_01765 [Candidatus Yanofskybacteria bacterium CG10_big_fil_rev_8_21_14_0_10_46_23]|uniref:DUF3800 domain-containing protein n=1 Tax=Candidatus Yanofskybacteria bacterium CG10_big_fil_rev_8_21_14_0_10_46_23 TaxID=1975098 RepID=A0A2H0R5M9_9BACT|nr:MAG: hypothetical protein COV31_01765 [Candidatus Yanofskybacteria bacterium CG10_big_fil_rev_8_21_14_0_10_46_23]